MRVVGVVLALFGLSIAYFLGWRGDDPKTLGDSLFQFFKIAKPASIAPPAPAKVGP